MEPLVVRVEDTDTLTVVDHAFVRSPVRIGRSARNDLCLSQRFVSAWHALVEFDDRAVRYTDLGSTNGSLLNGDPVEPRAAVPVDPETEVLIGSLRLTFPPREKVEAKPKTTVMMALDPAAPARSGAAAAQAAPPAQPPLVRPGGITAVMKKLASAPSDAPEQAWRRLLVPGAVIIGRFELVREVGRGSFGVVFEAKDRQLGRLVAFKAVRPGRESQIMFRQQLLQKEAEAVAQLSHPNIVSLYDAGTCDGAPYLIMELLKGEPLRARMARGHIPLKDALEIAIEIAWALDHAHAAGVIHRDLKPANVFLCANGQVKVLDFGIAHVFGAGSKRAVGTPAYMAPEQWLEAAQDARTDVFGAAVTLMESVTGRLPYRITRDSTSALEPGARPDVEVPGAPAELKALLRRALSPTQDERPRDGHAWLAELVAVHELLDRTQPLDERSRSPVPARPLDPARPLGPPRSHAARATARMETASAEQRRVNWRALIPVLLAVALAISGFVYVLLR